MDSCPAFVAALFGYAGFVSQEISQRANLALWSQGALMRCSTASCSVLLQIPSACGLESLLEKISEHLFFMPSLV